MRLSFLDTSLPHFPHFKILYSSCSLNVCIKYSKRFAFASAMTISLFNFLLCLESLTHMQERMMIAIPITIIAIKVIVDIVVISLSYISILSTDIYYLTKWRSKVFISVYYPQTWSIAVFGKAITIAISKV